MFSAFVLDIRLKVILALTIISLVQQRLERCFPLTKKQSDPVETSVTQFVSFGVFQTENFFYGSDGIFS